LRIELVCVGSELLSGKVSTHGASLGRLLEDAGLALARETTVGDDREEMRRAFAEAWKRSDAVVCSGGLGPTFDDITRDVWSALLRRPLRFRRDIFLDIRAKFRRRGLRMPAENRRQAFVLSGAEALPNPHGTAPGQLLAAGGKLLALLPGPHAELFPMLERAVLPRLLRRSGPLRKSAAWKLSGVAESVADEKLDRVRARHRRGVVWGILAERSVITVKASAEGPGAAERIAAIGKDVRRVFGRLVMGGRDDTLESAVARRLRERRQTLAAAESCTGGLLAEKLTRLAGSSDYFLQGAVTYSNESKVRLLGVKRSTLKRRGAVSAECAREMARGCRTRSGADWAVSVTGIAGPGGAVPGKPVGTVFFGLAGPRGVSVKKRWFAGERAAVRERSAQFALDWLRKELA
jgi:nicotinamide-nucleotide amidase